MTTYRLASSRARIGLLGIALVGAAVDCDRGDKEGAGSEPPAPSALASAPAPVPSGAPTTAPPSSVMVIPPPPTAAAALPGPLDTIIAQHILVTYKGAKRAAKTVLRTKAQAKARAEEALAKVRAGTAFEDAVDTYSDDAASVDRMGSVGKFHRADMDPLFSAAAFALHVNEVSGLVETPFGFHIIKRTQ